MLTNVPARTDLPAQPSQSFPLIVADDIAALRSFYVDTMGCTASVDTANYLQVKMLPGDEVPELCFATPETAGGAPAFRGGFLLSIPVGDVDALQAKLEGAKVPIVQPATDMPWRWRSVRAIDPAGVVLDFFHVLGDSPEQ